MDQARRVRAAMEQDLDAVVAIAESDRLATWSGEAFASELDLGWSRVEVAEEAGIVVGFVVYWAVADEIQVMNIATHLGHRRSGVGWALVERLIDQARDLRAGRIALEVRESNVAARALYERCGFRVTGRSPGYYQRQDEAALLMTLEVAA